MEKVRLFLQTFLEVESEAFCFYLKQNIDLLNEKLDQLNNLVIKSLHDGFGMVHQDSVKQAIYELYKNRSVTPNPRRIFKIERYKTENTSSLFLAYLSDKDPDPEYLYFGQMFAVSENQDELKIISQFSFDSELSRPACWSHVGGTEIDLSALEGPIEIFKILSPNSQSGSINEYNCNTGFG